MTGSGTALDPYIIQNVTDLQNIELALSAYYELGGNIDASGSAFIPITDFTGSLNGKGYTIDGLNMALVGDLRGGLFDITRGIITDVKLTNISISVISTNYSATGAAFCRYNYGTITDCYATGIVTITAPIIVYAGGLVVNNVGGAITRSYSDIELSATGTHPNSASVEAGGLVRQLSSSGLVQKCYSLGNVVVDSPVSGLSAMGGGFIRQVLTGGGTISDCYSKGNVTSSHRASGFVDQNRATITNSYCTGVPSGGTASNGFNRYNSGTISGCFWDTDASGVSTNDGGGTGKTTVQMKRIATYLGASWNIGRSAVALGDGYPILSWTRGGSPIWLIKGLHGNPIIDQLIYQHAERMEGRA